MPPVRLADNPGHAGWISTRERHRIATLTVRDDALISVRSGRKSLVGPAGVLSIEAGESVAMPRGTQWDVINDPAGAGRYEACVLTFSDALIQHHADVSGAVGVGVAPPSLQSAKALTQDEQLRDAVTRAAATLLAADSSALLRQHRLVEVLILLAERGICFRPGGDLTWRERIRRLVAHRPHDVWDAEQVAAALHLSASTLRRRLETESPTEPAAGSGIAGIVREVRLETALGLLQTTQLPVGEVAARCGWGSHSRFTEAFQARWGFAPSLLRGPTMIRAGKDLTRQG